MLIVQTIINIILLFTICISVKQFKIKIDIHNLPIFIFFILFSLTGSYFAIFYIWKYIFIGSIFAILALILNLTIPFPKENSIKDSIITSILMILGWSQFLILMIFIALNIKQINLNEKQY